MNNWIEAEMLGDIATNEQADEMAALLISRGIEEGSDVEQIAPDVWGECLDIVGQPVELNGQTISLHVAAFLMDDTIRERLHRELAPCEAQVFMDAYVAAHLEAFGEQFTV